jgi:hypothetical protein
MKKIYIILTVLIFMGTGCSKDFIDLVPEDSLSPSTFYQTDAQLYQGVIAAYVPLRDLLVNDSFASEMHSDNTHYQPSPSNRGTANIYREAPADWINDANNDYTNAIYYHCYTGISRANIVIGRIPDAKLATVAGKAKADGEAKFLRAFNYFKLVRLFGGVPLHLTEVTKADDAFLPRATVDQVYAQIIADAKDAISELNPPVFTSNKQGGEATKGSATVLLADVFVTLKRYAEAEALLNTLPAMGYTLNAVYDDAFKPTNKNSRESMFEVQYLEGTAVGTQPNALPFTFLPKTANSTVITGAPSTNTTGNGGWNKPTPDLISTYETGDKRLPASIGMAEGTYDATYNMTITANPSVVGYVAPAGKVGQPYIKKFLHAPFVAASNSNTNWPIYRYAEALLLLAEAQNEQGKSPLTALNALRPRTGLGNITETNQALLRDIIIHERRVELAFENKRVHDLQRIPNGLSIMQAYAIKAKTYPLVPATAFDIQPYKFLFPIPSPERGLNSLLTQNPGYTF